MYQSNSTLLHKTSITELRTQDEDCWQDCGSHGRVGFSPSPTAKLVTDYRIYSLSGLGLATVQKVLDLGAYAAVIDLTLPDDAKKRESSNLRFFQADVSDEAQVRKATDGILSWSAESSLPIAGAVCCAGYLGPMKVRASHESQDGGRLQVPRFSPRVGKT